MISQNPSFDNWFASVQFKSDMSIGARISTSTDARVGWRSSIHLPKHLSRITVEIENIWVERLQDISMEDVNTEGFAPTKYGLALYEKTEFAHQWSKINAKRGFGWNENPFVWAIEFKKI